MKTFIKIIKCPHGLFGVFEDDGETGYLYSYLPDKREIKLDLIIYQNSLCLPAPSSNDIKLDYDKKSNLCGIYVWEKLRGYIEFPALARERLKFFKPDDPGLTSAVLPEIYNKKQNDQENISINEKIFIKDRQKYWKNLAKQIELEQKR